MLPSVTELERLIGGLGIDASTRVVIAPLGEHAKSMASAARLYWTFKALGHDRVSILNSGTRGYAADKSRAMATGAVDPVAKTFRARPREEMLATSADVAEAAAEGALLVDYRWPTNTSASTVIHRPAGQAPCSGHAIYPWNG